MADEWHYAPGSCVDDTLGGRQDSDDIPSNFSDSGNSYNSGDSTSISASSSYSSENTKQVLSLLLASREGPQ